MKKLMTLLLTMVLCFTIIPALSEDAAISPEFNPDITMTTTPDPGWAVTIHCEQAHQTIAAGSTIVLTADITTAQPDYYNIANYNVTYNWQAKAPEGEWFSVGSAATYEFSLNAENVNWVFRVIVTLTDKPVE